VTCQGNIHIVLDKSNFCICCIVDIRTISKSKEIDFGGIVSSSKISNFALIPRQALLRLIKTFELDIERKGDKAWNALSSNQNCLGDKKFIIERISHVINHAYQLLEKVQLNQDLLQEDDAAALAWSGIFLCEATRVLMELEK